MTPIKKKTIIVRAFCILVFVDIAASNPHALFAALVLPPDGR
jgi:hypothetical protein